MSTQDRVEWVEYCHREMGWSFTPLNGKMPKLKGWQRRDRETVHQAKKWANLGNIGVRTGAASNGLIVIDVDPGADVSALNLPDTVRVETGRPGAFHLYFIAPSDLSNSAGKLTKHVDVRGTGGQVVFPGSVHPDTGAVYTWAEGKSPADIPIAELPTHITEALEKPREADRQQEARSEDDTSKYVQAAFARELKAIETAPEGTRNNALNIAAFNIGTLVGGGYLSEAEALSALVQAGRTAGLTPSEADATARSGLQAGKTKPRKISTQTRERHHQRRGSGKPEVLCPGSHLRDGWYTIQGNGDFARSVSRHMPPGLIYRRASIAGELVGKAGSRRWMAYRTQRMQIQVDDCVDIGQWNTNQKTGETTWKYTPCRREWADLVIAHAEHADGVKDLKTLVPYPVYGPDWKLSEPGWNENGIFYDQPWELEGLVPETDIGVIHRVLTDLLADFPFKSQADWENFVGLMLTPLVAHAIDGNRPLHLIGASLERTGKTKLAEEVVGGVILGRPTPAMQVSDREDERRKSLFAMLLDGDTICHLDNMPAFVDSASLSSLLTASTYTDRILGRSERPKLQNAMTVVASGNNVEATGELVKRCVPIILQPKDARPEGRRDFKHPDLRVYVKQVRRRVLACLLGLIENWLQTGRSLHPHSLGSFEAWSRTVGGILALNGYKQWRANESEWRKSSDPRGQETEAFIDTWQARYGYTEQTVGVLCDMAIEAGLFADVRAKSESARPQAMGYKLRRLRDTPVGSHVVRSRQTCNKTVYKLEPIGGEGGSS